MRSNEVLLVEDREEDALLAMRELERSSLVNRVHWVEDGEEALDYLQNHAIAPKLILLDLKIPKVSGIEVLRYVRKYNDASTVPVVIMSSSKESTDIEKSYEYGVNSYVVKPVDYEKYVYLFRHLSTYWLKINEPPGVGTLSESKLPENSDF